MNTCDALIVSEIVFQNILTDLSPEEAVALMSGLVFQQKNVSPQLELVPENLRYVCDVYIQRVFFCSRINIICIHFSISENNDRLWNN